MLSALAERCERSSGHGRQRRSSVAALRPLDGVLWNSDCSSGGRQHQLLRSLQHARPGIISISIDPGVHWIVLCHARVVELVLARVCWAPVTTPPRPRGPMTFFHIRPPHTSPKQTCATGPSEMALAAACSQLAHEVAPGKDILNIACSGRHSEDFIHMHTSTPCHCSCDARTEHAEMQSNPVAALAHTQHSKVEESSTAASTSVSCLGSLYADMAM